MESVSSKAEAQGPVRMCCICRQRRPKADLDRYAGGPGAGDEGTGEQALLADPAKRLPGRGLYVCRNKDCQERFSRRKAGRKKRKQGEGECR